MTENTQPTGVDRVVYHCGECGRVLTEITGPVYGAKPLIIRVKAPAPCEDCQTAAKGH